MKPLDVSTAPRLVRALGPVLSTAVVVGTVIGSGIFKKPQAVAQNLPYFGLAALVWVCGGLVVLLGALSYAEVATLWPRAGGNYVFLREGYGRMAGFLWGWIEFWIIRAASLAALATLFTTSFHAVLREFAGPATGDLLGYWPQRLLTVAVIVGLALVNVRGVRWGGLLQLLITLVKVGSLLAIIALPFAVVVLAPAGSNPPRPATANLQPLLPAWGQFNLSLASKFGTALLGVYWAYHGWMNIAPVAEEIRNPQRNIPLSLLGGVGIIIALYLGTNLSYSLILTQDEMSQMKETAPGDAETAATGEPHDDTVAIGFSRRLLGPIGVGLAAAVVMCSVFGALNGNLLVGPRLLYAMGEDGLAPRALGAVHARYHTPALAILVMSAWASLLVLGVAMLTELARREIVLPRWLAEKDHFDMLTDFAMFGSVTFETMAVTSIFVFRWRMPDAPRSYRCWGYPVVPMLYVVLPALILGNMFIKQQVEALAGVSFIAAGALVYALFLRPRNAGHRAERS